MMLKNGNYSALPPGYTETMHLKLQQDKKTALTVNISAIVISAVMVMIPLAMGYSIFDMYEEGLLRFFIKMGIVLICYIIYIYLHEITHGVFIRLMSGKKAYYGFTGLYAYAGSDVFFNKRSYIIIALAPLFIWGIILAALQIVMPQGWGIVPYFVQIGNAAGAAGDIYVALKTALSPKKTLVRDTGIDMTFYSAA